MQPRHAVTTREASNGPPQSPIVPAAAARLRTPSPLTLEALPLGLVQEFPVRHAHRAADPVQLMQVHQQEEEVVLPQRGAVATSSTSLSLFLGGGGGDVGIAIIVGRGRGGRAPRGGGGDDGPGTEELHVGDPLRRARQGVARHGTTGDCGRLAPLVAVAS